MRPSSEGSRSIQSPSRRAPRRVVTIGAAMLATIFLLGACQTLEEVRKTFDPWQGPDTKPATAPPAPTTAPPAPTTGVKKEGTAPPAKRLPDVGSANRQGRGFPAPPGTAVEAGSSSGVGGNGIILTPPPGVTPKVRVGLLLPLSGPHRKLGLAFLNAAQLALFGIAGESFALLPVDTKGTPEGAALAAQNALAGGARLLLGPVFGASVQAIAPIARARGVQVVSFSNNRSVAGDGVYVMGFAPETQIRRVVSYARARGVQRIAAVIPAGPYGERVVETLRGLALSLGLEIKAIVRYGETTTDALSPLIRNLANYDVRRAVLLGRRKELEGKTDEASRRAMRRLKNLDTIGDVEFDAVLLPQGGPPLRAIAPLLPFYDIDTRKIRVLGSVEWDDPLVTTEPALFGGWFAAAPPTARRSFDAAYKASFGRAAPPGASLAYDATALAAVIARTSEAAKAAARAKLLKQATETGAAVPPRAPLTEPVPSSLRVSSGGIFSEKALTAANGFSGADGIFRLLPSGLVQRGLAIMEVRSRNLRMVSPAPRTFEQLAN